MKTLGTLLALLVSQVFFSQVGIGTTSPHPSSILHLNSTNSGLLVPRLTGTQKTAITSPATGLLIYQTDGAAGFWYFNGSVWLPFGNTYTFNNGLTLTGSNARLGGQLIQNTTLDVSSYNLTIQTSDPSSYPGEFIINGRTRNIMKTRFDSNYIQFGNDFPFFDTNLNGSNFNDIFGDPQTVQIVAGFTGEGFPSAGSCIKVGSIEYMYDDQVAIRFVNASLLPSIDQSGWEYNTLGSSSLRWRAVFATDGLYTTSDMRFKTNITPVKYGLNEVLQLNTFSYDWKNDAKSLNPNIKQKKKIGFSAQQLLELIPEVVQEESILKDEDGNIRVVKDEKLAVNYSELIPVLVNAIQEQQKQIEELKAKIEILEKK
jgi:hypothetical protein